MKHAKSSLPLPLYLLVLSIWVAWAAPTWWSRSMFMDGLWYATIARNLSVGMGSLWTPQLTETLGQTFTAHPPLAFWIESLWFRLLGDHWWVERLFSGSMMALAAAFLMGVWSLIPGLGGKQSAWLPLLLWIIMPLVPWAVGSHMLENPLTVFLLGSTYAWLRFYHQPNWGWLFLAGLGVWLGVLTKGPPALFVLTLPTVVGLLLPEYPWLRGLRDSAVMVLIVILLTGLLLLWPAAWQFALAYVDTFLRGNLAVQIVSSRWFILGKWVNEILPPLLLLTLLWGWLRKDQPPLRSDRWCLVFLIVGLAGVLPYMLVLKQRGFYLLPALPFFALAMGAWIAPAWQMWWARMQPRIESNRLWHWGGHGSLLIALIVVIFSWGRPGKHADQLALADAISQHLPTHSQLYTCSTGWQQWSLHGYVYRKHYVSLSREDSSLTWQLGGKFCPDLPNSSKVQSANWQLGTRRPQDE